MEQRGGRTIAGTYSAMVTESCETVPSGLFGGVFYMRSKNPEIAISQNGFKASMTQKLESSDGRTADITHGAVVVGALIIAADAMAPDFSITGEVKNNQIELRPDVERIKATYAKYPSNFPPRPNWDALSQCVLTLRTKP